MQRSEALQKIARHISTLHLNHPVRVAIDGVDGSGKTHLANEIAAILQSAGQHIIRASIDGFHNPRAFRYARGRISPEGYYFDSFNTQALIVSLLLPLGPRGNLQYKTRVFDYRFDRAIHEPIKQAAQDSILLMDGIFLQRPELFSLWDFRIFVDADFSLTRQRAVDRDIREGAAPDSTASLYSERYIPGQLLYFQHCNPRQSANLIFDNTDFQNPKLITIKKTMLSSMENTTVGE